jgi:hypothetical protein
MSHQQTNGSHCSATLVHAEYGKRPALTLDRTLTRQVRLYSTWTGEEARRPLLHWKRYRKEKRTSRCHRVFALYHRHQAGDDPKEEALSCALTPRASSCNRVARSIDPAYRAIGSRLSGISRWYNATAAKVRKWRASECHQQQSFA